MLISQAGYYKGTVLDGGVGESSGGFPQCNLALKATEVYDPETDSWLPANPEADEINYYGTLMQRIDTKQPASITNCTEGANAKQVKKIFGWDGASYAELQTLLLPDTPIQFRVEPNTYNEKTTLQVSWIDEPGASPVRGVRKLDADGVKALQAKYAGVLASTKAPKKAVSAPVKAPVTSDTVVKEVVAALTPTKPTTAPPKRAGRPAGKPVAPNTNVGKCTADEAWAAVSSLKRDDVTDEVLTTEWTTAIQTVTGDINTAEEKITPENWFQIKELVLAKTAKV
jgi:hypothetical protein